MISISREDFVDLVANLSASLVRNELGTVRDAKILELMKESLSILKKNPPEVLTKK